MSDNEVPEEIVEFFRRVRDLADDAVRRLERAAADTGGRQIEILIQDSVGLTDSVDAVVRPDTVRGTASVWSPAVTVITPEEVEAAKSWLGTVRGKITAVGVVTAAGAVWHGADVLSTLDGLISLAQRIVGIGD